jgi:curved DNA-binding protein CbpA
MLYQAYEILSNTEERSTYDKVLAFHMQRGRGGRRGKTSGEREAFASYNRLLLCQYHAGCSPLPSFRVVFRACNSYACHGYPVLLCISLNRVISAVYDMTCLP